MNYILTKEIVDRYLQECSIAKELNAHTLKAYQIDLKQFLCFMEPYAYDVQKESLHAYILHLHKTYQKPKTIKRKIASINALFSYLVFHDLMEINPMSRLRTSFREPRLLPRTIPYTHLSSIFNRIYDEMKNCKTSYQRKVCVRNAAVMELLFSTGMRVSELCHVRDEEINLREQYVRIYGKGSKERILQIGNPDVLKILYSYRSMFQKEIETSGFFFINKLGNPLSEQSVRLLIARYEKALKIPQHLTPHMFRHTFATQLLEEDVDIRYIQHILGHSSITTTQIYTHISSNKQKGILYHKNPRNFINQS